MDTLLSQVSSLATQNLFLAYFIIYLATIFFGNVSAFISLWIAFENGLGAWGIPFVLITLVFSNLTGDLLWYSLGRGLRTTRLGNWIKKRIPKSDKLESQIERKGRTWMLFGKFAYGSNFPIIFLIGWTKIKFASFFTRSLLAVTIWLPIILGVSYGLYSSLIPIASSVAAIKHLEIFFLIGIILFFVAQYVLVKIFYKLFGKRLEIGQK